MKNAFQELEELEGDTIPTADEEFVEGTSSNTSTSHHRNSFPKVCLPDSLNTFNPIIVKALVQIMSKYKVSDRDLEGVVIDIANMIFGQEWVKSESSGADSESESEEEIEGEDWEIPFKKVKTDAPDVTNIFPSRRTRRRWLR